MATMPQGELNGGTNNHRGGANPRALARRALDAWQQREPHDTREERLARALGWVSIGLGVAALAAPHGVARLIGIKDGGASRTTLRAVGLREITSGIGILSQPRPAPWVWSRVGGDLMDLALLGRALASGRSDRDRVTAATAAVVGITALDVLDSVELSRRPGNGAWEDDGMHVRKAITVRPSPAEVFQFWQDFENLPRFMSHLQSVQVTGERRSHWKTQAPAGQTVEWDAEVTELRPNELIAWRSLQGADVDNSGVVRFRAAPGGQGTEVEVELQFDAPGGKVGRTIAKLFGKDPGQQVASDLRRFKQVLEAGEVVLSDATVEGAGLAQRPAQPPEGRRPLATAGR
jgi:uncharacterized membrane protein